MLGSQTAQSRPKARTGASVHIAFRHCLPPCSQRRRSEAYFRGSMASLNAPLSTLHGVSHEPPRMTRGRCRSLHVHRLGLSP